jgi:hypothetical protein
VVVHVTKTKNNTLELITNLNRFLSFETLDMGQLKKYVKAPRPGAGTSPLVPESQSTSQPGPSGV